MTITGIFQGIGISNHVEERGLGEELSQHNSKLPFVILVIPSKNSLRTGSCSHYELESHIKIHSFPPQVTKGGGKRAQKQDHLECKI